MSNQSGDLFSRFMRQQQIDGGPAFPGNIGDVAFSGMTLLDYIAIHATQQDINPYIDAAPYIDSVEERSDGQKTVVQRKVVIPNHVARYAFAQAMLEQSRKVRT